MEELLNWRKKSMDAQAPENSTALNISTRLAFDRTRLALDRTMMAWVRTATSLISFGFTIYKFFQFEIDKQAVPGNGLIGPREFALILISLGLGSLVMATLQHRSDRNALKALDPGVPRSTAALLAGLIASCAHRLGGVCFIADRQSTPRTISLHCESAESTAVPF